MQSLIIPNSIKKGDTIGIICPSAGVNPRAKHRIINAIKCMENMDFKVKMGKCIFSDDYTSGTVKERVRDLHEMFIDKNVKAIITGIGGNHCNQLLRFIDYSLIRDNPKIFSGYSDITVLHHAIWKKAGLATYYGPCAVTQFGEFPDIIDYTKRSFLDAVSLMPKKREVLPSNEWTDEFLDWFLMLDTLRAREMNKNIGYKWLKPGSGIGEALPVCNFSINRLAGTEFWINPESKIVFLDLVLESLNYPLLDASLTDLFNVGFFDDLRGLIIGRPKGFSSEEIKKVYAKILGFAKNKNYPILANFDLGHTDPINTVRYGQRIEMDSVKNKIIFYE